MGAAPDTLRDSTAYDTWGRLIRWAPMKGTSPEGPGESYSYDRGSNLHVAGETLVIDPVTERLTSRTVGGVTTSYTYDRAGNLVTRVSGSVTWTYGYDPLDRLVSVRRNTTLIARYGYDVLGRRIVKRVYSAASGGTVGYTRFVYKGSHVSFETDSAGTIGLKYTWGAGTDDLVAITTDAGLHYYVTTDKLGSVRSIAKRDGTWQLSQRFDPYGRLLVRDSASGATIGAQLRYGWTGREWDEETGFSYHRARYFDPESRRWTQEDPIGYAGGENVYAYVGGSPMESRDPSGMIPSGDGATHASRLWHAATAEDPWLMLAAGRPEEYYNFAMPVYDPWSMTYFYNIHGTLLWRVPDRLSGEIHMLVLPGPDKRLDYGLTPGTTPYTIEEDPDAWEREARAAADERIAAEGACNDACFVWNSLPGHDFDFKGDPRFPLRKLWNGDNGTYYHSDVVANTAWAMAGRHYEYSCSDLHSMAHLFTKLTSNRWDDPWDQFGIRRGC